MKVCHVFLFFSIKYAGGTSDFMFKLCKAQADLSDIETWICSGDYKFDGELASALPKTKFKLLRSYLNEIGFSVMPSIIRFCRKELKSFDVVHMHAFRTFQNAIIYRYCRKYKIPYVIDAHGAVPYYKEKRLLKRVYDIVIGKKMLRGATKLIAETEIGVNEYLSVDKKLTRRDVDIISPPFDVSEFSSLPEVGRYKDALGIKNKKMLVFLGRLNYIKGLDFLVDAFSSLLKIRDDVRLVLAGPDDGVLLSLREQVGRLSLNDKVIFPGYLFGEDKVALLRDADIFIQPSRHEQGAWAPIEAVLCETPIIVSDKTGAGEDVKRLNAGYTVDFGDCKGMVDQIMFILDNPDVARDLTIQAKRYVENNLTMTQRVHEYSKSYGISVS